MGHAEQVIGREPELGAIDGFLARSRGGPGALLIEGDAGIGKTTLWEAGVAAAPERGYRVLTARIGASETKLSFTALGDLLEPVLDEALPQLPEAQRAAIEVALLRVAAAGAGPEQRAVALGCLGVLRSIARDSPVLLALDDLQWLDASSAKVLGFAFRRLREEPISALVSVRVGDAGGDRLALDRTLPAQRVGRVFVGPMSQSALARMIRARTGADFPHPIILRIVRLAGGNPFFALQIANELIRRGIPAAGESFPVPEDLRGLLRSKLRALPKTARAALLAAAATSRPTERLIAETLDLGSGAAPALAKAEQMGVVRIAEGRINFAHPLLESTVYEAASRQERRQMHRRLADHVGDPEERARHLALAAEGPDADVATALDEAARLARARGAPEAAADLSELARRLTPIRDSEGLRLRTVHAAQHHFDAGDAARSTALFDEAIESAPPGLERARILFTSGSHGWMDLRRVEGSCERAMAEAEGDIELLAEAREHLAWVAIYRGDLEGALEHASAALRHAEAISSPAHRAEAFATFGMVEFLRGRPSEAVMSEAGRLQEVANKSAGIEATVYTSAKTNQGLQLLWAGELDAARAIFEQELSEYERRGRYLVRDEVLGYLGELECRAGNWELAARHAEEAHEIDVESGRVSGLGHTMFNKALVSAHRGDVDAAVSEARQGLRVSIDNEDPFYESCNRAVLGFVELSRSEPSLAIEHLQPVIEYLRVMGAAEPGVIPCVPDAIECLVSVGELDAAERLLEEHEQKGRRRNRPWALATAGRCRALLLAYRGDSNAGLESIELALREHERVPQPFELGRTLLAKGEVARRAKRKAIARGCFEEARSIFDRLGAKLWLAKARAGLARVGRAAAGGELTPTERRIVDLVVEGKTNREIADALFISIKTVEANLSRTFHKLAVHSRAQLIRAMIGARSGREPGGRDPA